MAISRHALAVCSVGAAASTGAVPARLTMLVSARRHGRVVMPVFPCFLPTLINAERAIVFLGRKNKAAVASFSRLRSSRFGTCWVSCEGVRCGGRVPAPCQLPHHDRSAMREHVFSSVATSPILRRVRTAIDGGNHEVSCSACARPVGPRHHPSRPCKGLQGHRLDERLRRRANLRLRRPA
jgi:hypothetical protein